MKTTTTLLFAISLCSLAACSSPKRQIRIPESVVPNPKGKGGAAAGDKTTAIQPYVIKMSDGKRIYEVQIPISQAMGAFSTSIPLDFSKLEAEPDVAQTEADREINDAKEAAGERTPKVKPGEQPKTRSYLATLAKVNDLFKKRQYELALIELTALERDYADDERVLEMKGTLLLKLKRTKQAKEAWLRVMALNPDNMVVPQALEQLSQDGE